MERVTPRLTDHARERCAEMGLPTKRAKRVVQDPAIVYPGNPGTDSFVAICADDPQLAVVYAVKEDGTPIIVTVLWNGVEHTRGEPCPFGG